MTDDEDLLRKFLPEFLMYVNIHVKIQTPLLKKNHTTMSNIPQH